MKLSRRKFVQLGSVTLAGIPFGQLTANGTWYENPASSNVDPDLYEAFKNPVGTAKPYVDYPELSSNWR